MYPYHQFHHMGRFHRGPSRLLWFVLGGLTATWWYKHKEADKVAFGHCIRRSMQNSFPDAPPFIPTREAPAGEVPQSAATNSTEAPQSSASRTPQSPSWPQSVGDIPRAINNIPPSYEDPSISFSARVRASMGDWESRQDYQWQSERDHLAKISRQATDAMADLTESTLDSVLSTAEALKAKLSEHRAQREKQQKLIEQELEEQRKDPPRLV